MLGSPIGHSLSPALHRAAYAELGLDDWVYDRFEVTEDGLAAFVAGCDARWRGLSLTMPLKRVALDLAAADETVRLVGAANTLVFEPDGPRLYNTDVGGLVAALQRAGVPALDRVTLLGAGATTRSALASVSRLGATEVTVLARRPERAEPLRRLAERLGLGLQVRGWDQPAPPADLLLSTVPAGAVDDRADELASAAPVVFDAGYDPWPTALARAAEEAGRVVVSGLDLLVGQAVEQIELMTGRAVDPALLLSAGRAALGRAAAG